MRPASTIAALLLLAVGARAALPLPDYVRPCSLKLSDRKFSQCCLERAREIIPKVMKGDPKYNVPVLDPLHVNRMDVINGDGPLGMQLVATDVNIRGLPNMVIDTITHQSNPNIDTYVVTIPEAVIYSKYNISGRILLLPLSGQGNAVMKFKNLKMIYQFDAKFKKKEDGEIYYEPQPGARLDTEIEGMTVHLDNLFNGDKTLLESTNQFLNNEWRDVFASLKGSYNRETSRMITKLLNGIFTQVPVKDAFLDAEEFIKSDPRFKLSD